MTPLTLALETIVDYGAVVSLVGKDQATGRPVAVHLDYCPPPAGTPRTPAVTPAKFAAFGLAVAVEFAFTADLAEEPGSVPLREPRAEGRP